MNNKSKKKMLKMVLWKEALMIPLYTILFTKFISLFWILLIIDKSIILLMVHKSINIDELMSVILEENDKKLNNLAIFAAISNMTFYIINIFNNQTLFFILIILEVADYIVLKISKKQD